MSRQPQKANLMVVDEVRETYEFVEQVQVVAQIEQELYMDGWGDQGWGSNFLVLMF